MPVTLAQSTNLFDLAAARPNACLAHGCNAKGVMGAGIAVRFKAEFPGMFDAYRAVCMDGKAKLGTAFVWALTDGRLVYNIFTQPHPGRTATYDFVFRGLASVRQDMIFRNRHELLIPTIACGLGGLKWTEVRKLVEGVFGDSSIDLTVCLPPAGAV